MRRREGDRNKDGEAESERRRWGGAYLPLKSSDEKINTQETVWGEKERGLRSLTGVKIQKKSYLKKKKIVLVKVTKC